MNLQIECKSFPINPIDERISTLLKEATKRGKEGDMDGAIKLLREAYAEIGKSSMDYTVKTFLRLPLYLQKAKKNDDAWKEFNLLLAKGYPNQLNTPELLPMNHSIIYDKMCLFLQREGKYEQAVRFYVFSLLSWEIGLYRQKRNDELGISKQYVDVRIKKILKKVGKENLAEQIVNFIEEQINAVPNVDFRVVGKKIDEILI